VVAISLLVVLAFVAAVLSLAGRADRLRRRVERLERRVQALELESAATLVIEPDALPRSPSQLLN
jgi:hypothetical protein